MELLPVELLQVELLQVELLQVELLQVALLQVHLSRLRQVLRRDRQDFPWLALWELPSLGQVLQTNHLQRPWLETLSRLSELMAHRTTNRVHWLPQAVLMRVAHLWVQ